MKLSILFFALSILTSNAIAQNGGPGPAAFCQVACTGLKPELIDQAALGGDRQKTDVFAQTCNSKGGKVIPPGVDQERRDFLGCSAKSHDPETHMTYCIAYRQSQAIGTGLNPYYYVGTPSDARQSCEANLSLWGCRAYADLSGRPAQVKPLQISFSKPECIELD